MRVEILGVYPVDAPEPCHLIEVMVLDHQGPIDIGKFTQQIPGRPQENWQAPWDERVLDASGELVLLDPFPSNINAEGAVRLVFFFHYLSFDRPLITPAGNITVPEPRNRPTRLAVIEYRSPC